VNCKRSKRPSANTGFWDKKISGNMERDKAVITRLYELGWHTLTIWQCEIKDRGKIYELLSGYLIAGGNNK
jgi:DNA mismatch endonuclease (patch repair protein)